MSRRTRWLAVFLVPLVGLQIAAVSYYSREQRTLRTYLDSVTRSSQAPSEQAKEIVLSLKNKPDDGNDSYFLLPMFRFLRPTAAQVIDRGGDCADRSRLVIALLRLHGIHATKWALYDAKGESKHAVVEAEVETGKMVVDPLFGIWFPKPEGGYFAINDLRRDPNILLNRLKELRAEKAYPGTGRLEFYPTTEYIYTNARTINWTKSSIMQFSFAILRRVLGNRAYDIHRPGFAEEPPLMVLYGAAGLEAFLILCWAVIRKRAKRIAEAQVPRSVTTRDTHNISDNSMA